MAGFLETIFKSKNNNAKTNKNKKPGAKSAPEYPGMETEPLKAFAWEETVSEPAVQKTNPEEMTEEKPAEECEAETGAKEEVKAEEKPAETPSQKPEEMPEEMPEEKEEELTVDQTVLDTSIESGKEAAADSIASTEKVPDMKENDDTSIKDIIDRLQELVEKDGKISNHVDEVPSFTAFPEPEEPDAVRPEVKMEEDSESFMPEAAEAASYEMLSETAETASDGKLPEAAEAASYERMPDMPETAADGEIPDPAAPEISEEDPAESMKEGRNVIREVPEAVESAAAQEDDYLLSQIEELRTKAINLRQIMSEKESQANELISLVEERENQAQELQKILDERQEKADGITAQVEKQIDSLIETVENRMVTIERTMNSGADRVDESVHSGMQSLKRDMDARLEEIRILTKDTEPMRRITEEQTLLLQTTMESDNKELLLELTRLKGELSNLKGEVAEKIHNENVKCYRNVSDLIKENDKEHKTAEADIDGKLKSIRSFSVGIAICTALNICGIAALILFVSGVLHI